MPAWISSIVLAADTVESARRFFSDSQIWHDMIRPGVPILEKIVRPVIIYFFLVVMLRIFGKRELTSINPFDFVVLLMLSNTVQNAIIGEDNSLSGGLIGAVSLMVTNYLLVRFMFKHRRLDQLLEGSCTTLIEDGKVQKKALAKELLTEAELLTIVHRQGFSQLLDVEKCVLEPGGNFYVKGKTPNSDESRHAELLKLNDQLIQKSDELLRRIDQLIKKEAKVVKDIK